MGVLEHSIVEIDTRFNRPIQERESETIAAYVIELHDIAWVAAANSDTVCVFPLLFDPTQYSIYQIERGVFDALSRRFVPGSPGDEQVHQIGLDSGHLQQIIQFAQFTPPSEKSRMVREQRQQLVAPETYHKLIAPSLIGKAITLRAGEIKGLGTRLALVTKPGMIPSVSGA